MENVCLCKGQLVDVKATGEVGGLGLALFSMLVRASFFMTIESSFFSFNFKSPLLAFL